MDNAVLAFWYDGTMKLGTVDVFFFRAEDGIRGLTVTGVQTCALPIFVIPAGVDRAVVDLGEALDGVGELVVNLAGPQEPPGRDRQVAVRVAVVAVDPWGQQ